MLCCDPVVTRIEESTLLNISSLMLPLHLFSFKQTQKCSPLAPPSSASLSPQGALSPRRLVSAELHVVVVEHSLVFIHSCSSLCILVAWSILRLLCTSLNRRMHRRRMGISDESHPLTVPHWMRRQQLAARPAQARLPARVHGRVSAPSEERSRIDRSYIAMAVQRRRMTGMQSL